jgi:ferrous iron transport protein B
VFGIIMAAIVATVMSRTILRERDDSVFALELPPYRVPMLRVLLRHTLQKTREFVVKAGTVIFTVVVILWFAMSLPWGVEDQRDSYFGQASAAAAPIFEPAGFGTWQATGALATGFIAKEVVVSTMGQIYVGGGAEVAQDGPAPTVGEDVREIASGFVAAVDGAVRTTVSLVPGIDLMPEAEAEPEDTQLSAALQVAFTPLAAVGFLIFVLVYTPCVATLAAIRDEFGWRWAALSGLSQFGIAWLLAVIVFQLGTFLGYA